MSVVRKKPPVLQFPNLKTVTHPDDRSWHNAGDIEIDLYARSLHRAAKNHANDKLIRRDTKAG
jgi:hypothetical protein